MKTMIDRNPDVPIEAVLKQVLKENRQLRQKIGELKSELDHKEYAIKKFKEWQANMANFKYNYWLNEGLRLASIDIDENRVKRVRRFLECNRTYESWMKKIEDVIRNMEKSRERVLSTSDES